MAKSKVSMKLLIDTNSNRVLFAEAEKDCVDFLFHVLPLPLARVIRLLREQGMVGSLANLYKSIENLNSAYIQPGQRKSTLLKPMLPYSTTSVPLLLPNGTPSVKTFYSCNYSCSKSYVSDDPCAICPLCSRKMTSVMTYVSSPPPKGQASNEGGFVKGMVTYMVTDDLEVKPLSTISGITLLNKLNVQMLSALEEKAVDVTMTEAVMLLKASLYSDNVLTEVFVKSKRQRATAATAS